MKMTQFANFANDATKQILGVTGLQRENLQSMFSYPDAINISDPKTVEGDIIHIDDGTPLDAKRLTVNINPYQAGRSTPTSNNIRKIFGNSVAKITVTKKCLFGGIQFATKLNELSNRSTIDLSEKSVTFDRIKTSEDYNNIFRCVSDNGISIIVTYITSNGNTSLAITFDDNTFKTINLKPVSEKTSIVVYSGEKTVTGITLNYFQAGLAKIYYDETGIYDGLVDINEFEPFNGAVYNVNLNNEIYGGFINVTNGSISVDRIKLKLGDFTNWNWHASTNSYTASRLSNSPFPQLKQGNIVCEIAPYVDRSQLPQATLGISISVSGTSIFLKDNVHSGTEDLEDFITAIQNVEAVFYIYTPQYYQIEPTDIMLLNGVNTIYADCGSMELEYYRRDNGGYMNG